MKKIIYNKFLWKIILISSLIPPSEILIISILNMFRGFKFLSNTTEYGIRAFLGSIAIYLIGYSPLLIVSIILIIISTIFIYLSKKRND